MPNHRRWVATGVVDRPEEVMLAVAGSQEGEADSPAVVFLEGDFQVALLAEVFQVGIGVAEGAGLLVEVSTQQI